MVWGGLLGITSALVFAHHGTGTFVFPQGPEVIDGDDGWALEVRPTPVQAVIGELLELQVKLTHDGQVFSGMMAVALDLYNLQDGHPLLRTTLLTPRGMTSPRVQFVEPVLYTCSMTVRPLKEGPETPDRLPSLTSVIGIEAVARPLPLGMKLQMIGLVLALVGTGGVGGLLLASGIRQVWARFSALPLR
jgi:hypothetical protein